MEYFFFGDFFCLGSIFCFLNFKHILSYALFFWFNFALLLSLSIYCSLILNFRLVWFNVYYRFLYLYYYYNYHHYNYCWYNYYFNYYCCCHYYYFYNYDNYNHNNSYNRKYHYILTFNTISANVKINFIIIYYFLIRDFLKFFFRIFSIVMFSYFIFSVFKFFFFSYFWFLDLALAQNYRNKAFQILQNALLVFVQKQKWQKELILWRCVCCPCVFIIYTSVFINVKLSFLIFFSYGWRNHFIFLSEKYHV